MPRYAAIDIGSNSLRMLVAEATAGGKIDTLIAERQVVRLGEGVFRTGRVDPAATDAVCLLLQKMAQTYRRYDVAAVRAVATSAVRDASNQVEFVDRASAALDAPVEIISGQEEARLIHLGVQARWPHTKQRVLTVDVGGGSAELILSENGNLVEAFSKPLGAVRLTEVFLKSDPPTAAEIHRMERYIDEKLAAPLERLGAKPYDRVIATSATAAALVCAINDVPRVRRDEADRLRATSGQIRRLYRELSGMNLASRRRVNGIGPKRAEIIVAGAAVFLRTLESFEHPSMYYLAAGVRDGIIADLAARSREFSRLSREQRKVVETMARRFGVALPHARRVAALAHELFEALQPMHKLAPHYGKFLEAAAYLHDTGHYVSDSSHHKHSYYLVAHSDLPGFTDPERHLIALLCRYHRKAMPTTRHAEFQTVTQEDRRAVNHLTPLLRIADSLDRSHQQPVEGLDVQSRNGTIVVTLRSAGDIDLEQWAAERVGESFRQVYGLPVAFTKERV